MSVCVDMVSLGISPTENVGVRVSLLYIEGTVDPAVDGRGGEDMFVSFEVDGVVGRLGQDRGCADVNGCGRHVYEAQFLMQMSE